eukprot:3334431-Pyramimonas_sp.AAC.1
MSQVPGVRCGVAPVEFASDGAGVSCIELSGAYAGLVAHASSELCRPPLPPCPSSSSCASALRTKGT